jgi:DNA invertase Pin-like site-specific DNA recombinase
MESRLLRHSGRTGTQIRHTAGERITLWTKGQLFTAAPPTPTSAQEATLRAYADEHGHTEIVRYRDNRANGLTLNRPALNELTAAVKAGEIGAVLVVNLSRIARNFMLVSEWRSLADGCGTALVSIGGGENAPTKI